MSKSQNLSIHKSVCALDCPDACALKITVEDGRMTKLEGNPDHPVTKGFACVKTYHYPQRQHHAERLLTPQKRVGRKGEGRFVSLSWQEALDEIAEKTRAVVERYGSEAVLPYSYAGTMGLVQRDHPYTFFRALGASELASGTICAATGGAAWDQVYGPQRLGTDCEDVVHSRFIILWGINSLRSNSHLTPFLKEARRKGAHIIHIDPYANETSRFADEHWQIQPCTDTALALAIGHVIFRDGLEDKDFLAKHASGLTDYRAACATWTPERAAQFCALEAADIERVARAYATSEASFIRVGYGMTRNHSGGNAMQAVVLLPALTGSWKYRGGGALLSTSGAFPLNKGSYSGLHLKQEKRRLVNMNHLASALNWEENPIKALFVFNSNPAAVAPNSREVRRGLARDDLFTVVLEHFQTDTADYADYLLPATTFLEHEDLYTAYGHYYLQLAKAVMPPEGACKPNSWVFQQLADRLGLTDDAIYLTPAEVVQNLLDVDHPLMEGISYQTLEEQSFQKLALPENFRPYAEGSHHEDGKIHFSPAPKQLSSEVEVSQDFPLRLITPPGSHFVNTSMGNMSGLRKAMDDEPEVLVHPRDAERYGLGDGQHHTLISPEGEITRRVRFSEATKEGVIIAVGLWWPKLAPDGRGVNELSHERLTDYGEGSMFGDIVLAIR